MFKTNDLSLVNGSSLWSFCSKGLCANYTKHAQERLDNFLFLFWRKNSHIAGDVCAIVQTNIEVWFFFTMRRTLGSSPFQIWTNNIIE